VVQEKLPNYVVPDLTDFKVLLSMNLNKSICIYLDVVNLVQNAN
jgi:hypothetical protein